MKIGFTLGENEQHQLELFFDQPSGDLCVTMDGAQVLRDKPRAIRGPVKRYELKIGEREKHRLAVQLTFEDEQSRRRDEQSSEIYATQPPIDDAPTSEGPEEAPLAWRLQALPRVSLMFSSISD